MRSITTMTTHRKPTKRRQSTREIDYFEVDKKAEEVYPIDPMNESRITHGELLLRHAKFHDYKRLWDWKLEQQKKGEIKG